MSFVVSSLIRNTKKLRLNKSWIYENPRKLGGSITLSPLNFQPNSRYNFSTDASQQVFPGVSGAITKSGSVKVPNLNNLDPTAIKEAFSKQGFEIDHATIKEALIKAQAGQSKNGKEKNTEVNTLNTDLKGTKSPDYYLFQYTCTVCDHVSDPLKISKQGYHKGVVIVQCQGCKNRHLIADNLGWFSESGKVEQINIETIMKEKKEKFQREGDGESSEENSGCDVFVARIDPEKGGWRLKQKSDQDSKDSSDLSHTN